MKKKSSEQKPLVQLTPAELAAVSGGHQMRAGAPRRKRGAGPGRRAN